MSYFHALILALIEGLTEFLPISSTGHLILADNLLKIPQTEFLKSFEIIIQLGAILAVVVLYRTTVLHSIEVWKKIMVAFIPTGIIGLIFYQLIKQYLLGNEIITLASLVIGGIILIVIEKYFQKNNGISSTHPPGGINRHPTDMSQITFKTAFIIGCFQAISVIPGVSRAAATIIGGRLLSLDRKTAVEFSFLLAIPTMAAATGLDLLKSNFAFTKNEYSLLTVGLIISFITALIAVKLFIDFIKKYTFIPFGVYRIILAVLYRIFII